MVGRFRLALGQSGKQRVEQVAVDAGAHPAGRQPVGIQLTLACDQPDAGVVHRGDTVSEVLLVGQQQGLGQLIGALCRHRGIGEKRRRLDEQAARLAARVPGDRTARWVRSLRGDADGPQRGGVHHAEVAGDMGEDHRVVR